MPPKDRRQIIDQADLTAAEAAVAHAYDRAAAVHGDSAANEAVREMLIALLAAAIITPGDQAAERADADSIRLMEIVTAALAAVRRPS